MFRFFLVLLIGLFISACNQGPETPAETIQDLSTRTTLSRFSCSDSSLTRLYRKVSEDFGEELIGALRKHKDYAPMLLENVAYQRSAQNIFDSLRSSKSGIITIYALLEANQFQAPGNVWDKPNQWKNLAKNAPAYAKEASPAQLLILEEIASSEAAPLNDETDFDFASFMQEIYPELANPSEVPFGDFLVVGLKKDHFPASLYGTLARKVVQGILEDGFTLDSLGPEGKAHVLSLLSESGNHDVAARLVQDEGIYADDFGMQSVVAQWLLTQTSGIQYGDSGIWLQPRLTDGLRFSEGQLQTRNGLFFCRIENQKPIKIQVLSPSASMLVLPVKDPTKATILANDTRIWMGSQPQPLPEGIEIVQVRQQEILLKLQRGKYEFLIKS